MAPNARRMLMIVSFLLSGKMLQHEEHEWTIHGIIKWCLNLNYTSQLQRTQASFDILLDNKIKRLVVLICLGHSLINQRPNYLIMYNHGIPRDLHFYEFITHITAYWMAIDVKFVQLIWSFQLKHDANDWERILFVPRFRFISKTISQNRDIHREPFYLSRLHLLHFNAAVTIYDQSINRRLFRSFYLLKWLNFWGGRKRNLIDRN